MLTNHSDLGSIWLILIPFLPLERKLRHGSRFRGKIGSHTHTCQFFYLLICAIFLRCFFVLPNFECCDTMMLLLLFSLSEIMYVQLFNTACSTTWTPPFFLTCSNLILSTWFREDIWSAFIIALEIEMISLWRPSRHALKRTS